MYFVIEIQKWQDGTWHTIVFQYEDRNQAESKYHYVLSEAAVAQIPRNGAILINDAGEALNSYIYQHAQYEPEHIEPMYFVMEIQKWQDGTWHTIEYQYGSIHQAESKYFTILAAAAVAEIPRNGAVLINNYSGEVFMSYVYQHGEYEPDYVDPNAEEE